MLLLAALIAFVKEWAPPELVAMSAFAAVIILGLISPKQALAVFQNDAPLTIGALFIVTAGLQATGAIDQLSTILTRWLKGGMYSTLLVVMLLAGISSAFINNTPIVAIFLPIVLSLSRAKDMPASKFLIPLSYATILGGCCTLIGTSTNLVASGMAQQYGLPPIGMFELAPLGLALSLAGGLFILFFGPKLLPVRRGVSEMLTPQERRTSLAHTLVRPGSPLVGKLLTEVDIFQGKRGLAVIEVRRRDGRLLTPLNEITLEANDRLLLGGSRLDREASLPASNSVLIENGLDRLATTEGRIMEVMIAPHSRLLGRTLRSAGFRQNYSCVILAVHRGGVNVTGELGGVPLDFGDTLLLLTPASNVPALRASGDFLLLDEKQDAALPVSGDPPVSNVVSAEEKGAWMPGPVWGPRIAWFAMGLVVILAVFEIVPIFISALFGCLLLMWTRCLTPEQAYRSVDWSILFMLYGMLGLGVAMEQSGAAGWLAGLLVAGTHLAIPAGIAPFVMLSGFYLLTVALTELLSNNATAVAMIPIAIRVADQLGVSSRPYVIAVCIASSAAFMLPTGYQTHMMVYGPGGYKFTDFIKIGAPLNILCWAISSVLIPVFWPLVAK